MEYQEPTSKEIVHKYIIPGFVKARQITKEETHKYSTQIKDEAWKAGEEIITLLADYFLNFPPQKKYEPFTQPHTILSILLSELAKSFQNSFRLAEEGYYRSAFGELRDMLEFVMKIKLFYEEQSHFENWVKGPNKVYTTGDMRKLDLFLNSGLNDKVEKFSNALSLNRHASSRCLDSTGKVMTNVCYYRKELFEKWCKHLIILNTLVKEIITINHHDL